MTDGGAVGQHHRDGTEVRLTELIAALSLATDLGSGQPMEHALRRCVLAVHLGELLGLSDNELRTVYYLALLQYIGCTADAHVLAAVFGDEVATGEWYASIASAQPPKVLAAMIRHIGEGNPPLRRAQRVATAFARLPTMKEVPAAHCEVGQRLADRLAWAPTSNAGLAKCSNAGMGRGSLAGSEAKMWRSPSGW